MDSKMTDLQKVVAEATSDQEFFKSLMKDPDSALGSKNFTLSPPDVVTLKELIRLAKNAQSMKVEDLRELISYAIEKNVLTAQFSRTIWPWPLSSPSSQRVKQ